MGFGCGPANHRAAVRRVQTVLLGQGGQPLLELVHDEFGNRPRCRCLVAAGMVAGIQLRLGRQRCPPVLPQGVEKPGHATDLGAAGLVSDKVLPRAFQYWKNIDEVGDNIEQAVRDGLS